MKPHIESALRCVNVLCIPQGEAQGQYLLARFTETGVGNLSSNKERAVELAKLAAAQDHQEAREMVVRLWE
jgi:TPR repeat protein